MLQPKPKFDPNKPFSESKEQKPKFDPNAEFEEVKKKDDSNATVPNQKLDSETKVGSLDGVGSNGFPKIDVNLGVPGLKPNLKTVEQLANPPKLKQTETRPIEKRGFASEVFHKLATGSSQLGVDIAAIPELLYDTFSVPQNAIADYFDLPNLRTDSEKFKKTIGVRNAVKELYQDEVKKLREQSALIDEKYKYGIYDSFKNGDIEGGLRQLTNSFAESLPSTTAIMLGGAYTKAPQLLATSTMMFGAGKNEQLKEENPEMSTNARVANALGTGFAEGAFETMGSGSIGAAAKGLVEKEGVKKGARILKDGLVDFYKSALAKSPFTASIVGEGVEEWATQVTQNAIDVATGAKPQDFNIFDGATDAFIGGSFGGSVFGAGLKGLEKIANNEDKVAIKSNLKKTFELQKALENPNISEESKAEIHKTIDGLVKTNQKLVEKNVDFADNLDPKLKEKLATADSKIDEIKNKIKAIKLDENTTDTQKQILLDGLREDFEKNTALKTDILNGTATVVDTLPLKEQDKLKRQALKELTAEQNPDGTKNIEIDNTQIVERANKIYLKENEKSQEIPITQEVENTQSQTEEQEKIGKVIPQTEQSIEERKENLNENFEHKIIVHATLNGFGLAHNEGIDAKEIKTPLDARNTSDFFDEKGNINQRGKDFNSGLSYIKEVYNDKNKNTVVSIVSPMTDNFGRSGGAVYEITIPKGLDIKIHDIRDVINENNFNSNLKGKELIDSNVKAAKDFIDSKRKETNTKPEAIEESKTEQIESISNKFEKSLTLLKDIESKQGVDSRNAKRERAEFLKQNPTIKYIDDNYKNIVKQLEEQGLFKQLKDC